MKPLFIILIAILIWVVSQQSRGPSEGQQQILKSYGINFWNDPIWQKNAFQLLHDMQDATWVSRYTGS